MPKASSESKDKNHLLGFVSSEEAFQTPPRHTLTTDNIRTLGLLCSFSCRRQLQKKSSHKRQPLRPVLFFFCIGTEADGAPCEACHGGLCGRPDVWGRLFTLLVDSPSPSIWRWLESKKVGAKLKSHDCRLQRK